MQIFVSRLNDGYIHEKFIVKYSKFSLETDR